MNKNFILAGLIVVVLLIALAISNSSNQTENTNLSLNNQSNSMDKIEDENTEKDGSMMDGNSIESMDKTESDDVMMGNDDAIAEEEAGFGGDLMEKDDSMMMAAGEYVDYDSSLLTRANDGNVVLFFHAGWCPTCKVLDNSLKQELSNFPKNLTVLKVDYDSASELKKKYAITYQHTLVQVDAQGKVINKWNGGSDLDSILEKLK